MKQIKRLLTAIVSMALIAAIYPSPEAKAADAGGILLSVDNKLLTYEYGKAQKFVIKVTNSGSDEVTNLSISPDMGTDGSQWPFKTEAQKYEVIINSLAAGETKQIDFNFTERDDVPSARYTIHFSYTADGGISGSQSFYVMTTAKPEEKKNEKPASPNIVVNVPESKGASGGGGDADVASAGGFGNGDAVYSGGTDGGSAGGGGSSSSGSVPRVIVTGFDTDPAEVRAGSDFKLTIHLKNTSKSTKVANMLFDLNAPTEGADEQTTAPAFLPSSGASSIYLSGIAADGTADISIQLNAKSDLLQKPYGIDLSMKYEDGNAAQIEASSNISIPVKQDARFEFSEFELSPESIAVGEESNVMCSLYNLGRIKLYNVKAVFEGTHIKKAESFIGNVESGATASVDAMLEGTKESKGPEKVTMTLSYEDEAGKATSVKKELKLEVTPATAEDEMAMEAVSQEDGTGFPLVPVVGLVVAAAAAIAAVVIVRKRKKKRSMSMEEEELLDELDGPSEDEC